MTSNFERFQEIQKQADSESYCSLLPCPSMWPKQFWSAQIDLDLTIMIWSWPKCNGPNQNELVWSNLWFSTKINHNLDLTNSFWLWPFHFGRNQIIMVKSKSIWTDQNCFGHIKGQGIKGQYILKQNCWPVTSPKKQRNKFVFYPDDSEILLLVLETWIWF